MIKNALIPLFLQGQKFQPSPWKSWNFFSPWKGYGGFATVLLSVLSQVGSFDSFLGPAPTLVPRKTLQVARSLQIPWYRVQLPDIQYKLNLFLLFAIWLWCCCRQMFQALLGNSADPGGSSGSLRPSEWYSPHLGHVSWWAALSSDDGSDGHAKLEKSFFSFFLWCYHVLTRV